MNPVLICGGGSGKAFTVQGQEKEGKKKGKLGAFLGIDPLVGGKRGRKFKSRPSSTGRTGV